MFTIGNCEAPDVSVARGAKPEPTAVTTRVAFRLRVVQGFTSVHVLQPEVRYRSVFPELKTPPTGLPERPRSKASNATNIVVPFSPDLAIRFFALPAIS